MTKLFSLSAILLAGSTSAAFAIGDHNGSIVELAAHMLTEPDHLAMLSVAAVVGVVLYRLSRRSA
jgi:hypothetical protein